MRLIILILKLWRLNLDIYRYFKEGLKKYFKDEYKGKLTLNKNSLLLIINFYKKYKKEFNKIQKEIKKESGILYSVMKLVDMYFWNIGFKKEIDFLV